MYGSTELGVDTVLKPEDQLRKPGSCGKPYGGIEMRIVNDDGTEAATGEPGELFVRTGLAMDGYHHTDEQLTRIDSAEAARSTTGSRSATSRTSTTRATCYICDRKKDMIISGGVNIYPAEIEAVLHAHPQVLDVAVFGIPDDEWGERVHAIVQAKPGRDHRPRRAAHVRRAPPRQLQAPARVRAARRAAAHRLGQAPQARAARRVLAGPELGGMNVVA